MASVSLEVYKDVRSFAEEIGGCSADTVSWRDASNLYARFGATQIKKASLRSRAVVLIFTDGIHSVNVNCNRGSCSDRNDCHVSSRNT